MPKQRRWPDMLLWSADYGEITGQALVTRRVVEAFEIPRQRRYTYRSGARGAVSWVAAFLRLWIDIALRRGRLLYLVCSRSNGGFMRDIPALLATYVGLRVVIHVHGSDIVDLLSGRTLSGIAKRLYARCELIVPSSHLIDDLAKIGIGAVHLCENYLLDTNGEEAPENTVPIENALTIFWNSNVMASKGFFDLAAAIADQRDKGLEISLLAAGRTMGDREMSMDEVMARTSRLNEEAWVDYRGLVAPSAVMAMMADADIVALPSHAECQPLAVIQAMCAGKALILSDIPAMRATTGGYPADFVPVRSVASLSCAIGAQFARKQTSPSAFSSKYAVAAAEARDRFSPARFDNRIREILMSTQIAD